MWKSTSHCSVAAQHEAMAVSHSINNSAKSSVFGVFASNGAVKYSACKLQHVYANQNVCQAADATASNVTAHEWLKQAGLYLLAGSVGLSCGSQSSLHPEAGQGTLADACHPLITIGTFTAAGTIIANIALAHSLGCYRGSMA